MWLHISMTSAFLIIFFLLMLIVKGSVITSCPSSCYCDEEGEYVSCVGDGLWDIPSDLPNTTVRLELRNYMANTLSVRDLQMVEELRELKLQQSHIEIVENATFTFNKKLQKLDLSQNSLSSLSNAVFYGLQKLRFLDLSSNNITIIEESFSDLVNLEILNLRDNRIPQLTTNTFIGLHKVQYLNLDANNISFVEVGTFQYLTNLAHLIISNNPLNTLSRLDFFGSRLQFIDISHVGLDIIPQSLTKFVRDLRLAKNNLTRISAGDFDSYPYLGLLVLDDNCVNEIENDALGRQEYLMRLWLNGNCLTKVPPNLPPSLLALYMEENKLTELHSYSFKGLVHLEQLFLQRNEIHKLDSCVFCDLVSLKSLDLQANQIEIFSAGVFANLSQLETLDLSQNKLKIIDARCFDGLNKLKTLQVSRVPTEVTLLDGAMFDPLHNLLALEVYDSPLLVHKILNSTRMLHGLRNVQELNIMHNRISHLRSDFPSFLPNLKVIKMSGNLWHCDKDMFWLTTWIKQSNIQFYSSYSIRCTNPISLQFKPLMMLTEDDFIETTTNNIQNTQQNENLDSSGVYEATYDSLSSTGTSTQSFSDVVFNLNNKSMVTNVTLKQSTKSYQDLKSIDYTSITSNTTTTTEMEPLPTKTFADPKFMPADPYRYNIISEHAEQSTTITNINFTEFENKTVHTQQNKTIEKEEENSTVNTTAPQFLDNVFTSPFHNSSQTSETILQTISTHHSFTDMSIQTTTTIENPSLGSQIVSAHRTVLSSRLRGWTQDEPTIGPAQWDHTTTVIVSAIVAIGGFLIIAGGLVTLITLVRCRHRYQPVKPRNMRRSSSISYYPQKDEVSIVTLTEGTVSLRTNSHHGLGNKLYYIMENGNGTLTDATKEALPDPQLQELLPQSTENANVF